MSPAERFRLDGQLALVTGASSGIGRHCSELLASMGAKVALASRRLEQLESLVKSIEQNGGSAKAFTLDVTNNKSVKACFDAITQWGVPSIVINNAGISVTKSLLEQTEADWDAGSLVGGDRSSTPHGGKQDRWINYQYGIDIRRAPNQRGRPLCDFQGRRGSDNQDNGIGTRALSNTR